MRPARRTLLTLAFSTVAIVNGLPRGAQAQSQAEVCKALGAYRDGPLFSDWDGSVRRDSIYAAERSDLTRLRTEFMKDSYWKSTDDALLRGQVAASLDILTTGINGVLSSGLAFAPTEAGMRLSEVALESLLKGADFFEAVQALGTPGAIAITIAAKANPVGVAVANVAIFSHKVKEMKKLPQDHAEFRRTVMEQLDAMDRALARNAQLLAQWKQRRELADHVRQSIDRYSLKYCR